MPRYGRRRGPSGPNKNEKKVQRATDAERRERSISTLKRLLPSIKRLDIQLQVVNPQQHVLAEKQLSLGPNDPCDFTIPCPGRCGNGTFRFAPRVEEAAIARLPKFESKDRCVLPSYQGSQEACGCELQCRMELSYLPPEAVPSEAPEAVPSEAPEAAPAEAPAVAPTQAQ